MIPDSLVRFRIGVARTGDQWRIVSQRNNDYCIIYDPPHDTKEDAIRMARLISDTYGANLIDEGVPFRRTVPDDYEGQWDADA